MWITWGCLVWATLWSTVFAQVEYLPPKVNGGGGGSGGGGGGGPKKPVQPVLPANYEFTYDVQDGAVSLDFGHSEKRKDDRASGSYHVLLPDGRTQLVEYEAGPDGFRPQVMYMGTATYPTSGGGSGGGGGGGGGDKFDGYHYNAASNRQSVRTPRPRTPPPPSPAPPPPQLYAPANVTQ